MMSFIFGMMVAEDTESADLAQWGSSTTKSMSNPVMNKNTIQSVPLDVQLQRTTLNFPQPIEEKEVNKLLWAPKCEKKTRSRNRPNPETQEVEEECIEKEHEEEDIDEFDDGDESNNDSSDPILSLSFFDGDNEEEEENDYDDDEEDVKRTLVFWVQNIQEIESPLFF